MKILLFDIETAPILAYVWQMYETDVLEVVEDSYMLAFAYKWYGEKEVKCYALPDFPLYKKHPKNDTELIKVLWKLFDEADIIIGHNADRFDIRYSNSRFIFHKLKPPSPYKTADTLKMYRKTAKFSSNKLDYLSKVMEGSGKARVDKQVWLKCMKGDMKEWKKMKIYNKRDVTLLENRYKEILPWVKHPNLMEYGKCPNCGGDTVKRGKERTVNGGYKRRHHCKDCGHWSYGKVTNKEQILR